MKKFFVIIGLLVISLFIIGCGTGKALYGAAALCGNDRLDADEECDSPPDNSGYFTSNCNSLGFDGGRIACTADCKLNTSGCNAPPAPAAPVREVVKQVGCGNDQLDPGEECDSPPDNSGYFTKVCNDLGFDGGRIACTSECKLNTSGCNPKSKSCSEGWICQSPYAKVYQYANCVLGNQSIYCANGCLEGACVLKPVCGNGKLEGEEKCDDGNGNQDDGCFECQLEGWEWSCSGEPSVCVVKIAPGNVSNGNLSNSS